MSARWLLFEIAINIFQGWLFTFTLRRRLTRREGISNFAAGLAASAAILAVAGFMSLYIWFDVPVTDSVMYGFTFVYSLYMFEEKWYIKLAWNVVLGVLVVMIASGSAAAVINLAGVTWEMLMTPSLLRFTFVLVDNILLFLGCCIVTRIKLHQDRLSWIAVSLFLLVNAALLVAVEMQYNLSWRESVPSGPVFTAICCILFALVGLFALFELLSEGAEKQARLEAQLAAARATEAHYAEMRSLYQSMNQYQHDMRHQIDAVRQMLREGNLANSSEYLEELERTAPPAFHATGCITVDALLASKMSRMQELGIAFAYAPYPLDELPVDEITFCAIIGNLVDNAIEAVQRAEGEKAGEIQFTIARTRDMLCITCKNPASEAQVRRRGREFLSSKRKNAPGNGIPGVRKYVEAAGGYCSFRIKQDLFVAEIVLPFACERGANASAAR